MGAARAPMRMKGRDEASGVGPSSQIVGSWTSEARGIQWPLLGIGSVGPAGIRPPTSTNDQMKSTLKP
jgi:hypothetical protein